MSRVLVIEDDRGIADLVALYLRRDGHEVCLESNGATGLRGYNEAAPPFDLLVLDLMLPGLDGRGICRRIRSGLRPDVPVLMLTALDDDRDKLEGFHLGADDYLTKPFNPDELVARVRALLRRVSRVAPASLRATETMIHLGRARIDLAARRLLVGTDEIALRTREFDLLTVFATHPDLVLTREQLVEQVWGGMFDGETRTVDVHVSRLRGRLAQSRSGLTTETVRSVGYRLVPRESDSPVSANEGGYRQPLTSRKHQGAR